MENLQGELLFFSSQNRNLIVLNRCPPSQPDSLKPLLRQGFGTLQGCRKKCVYVLQELNQCSLIFLQALRQKFIDTPYRYTNREKKEVMVAQVGWAGIKLGRIDFFIEKKSKNIFAHGGAKTIINKSC